MVARFDGRVLPGPLTNWRHLTPCRGPVSTFMRDSAYRPFQPRVPGQRIHTLSMLKFAAERRLRISRLSYAGLSFPSTKFGLLNLLNCPPVNYVPTPEPLPLPSQGHPVDPSGSGDAPLRFSCRWTHCPFCHARELAPVWGRLGDLLFPRPPLAVGALERPFSLVATRRVLATVTDEPAATLQRRFEDEILARSARSVRSNELAARGALGGIETVCAMNSGLITQLELRQFLLYLPGAPLTKGFSPAPSETAQTYLIPNRSQFRRALVSTLACSTAMLRGPIPPALAFAAAVGTTRRTAYLGCLRGYGPAKRTRAPEAPADPQQDQLEDEISYLQETEPELALSYAFK
jgi:hypothetical protein